MSLSLLHDGAGVDCFFYLKFYKVLILKIIVDWHQYCDITVTSTPQFLWQYASQSDQ